MILNKEGIRAKILNYGRSGYTSGEYLNFLKKNKETLKTECPDFVLLQLGTNDVRLDADSTPSATFKANMKKIVEIFRTFKNRQGKETIILLATIPPIPEGSPFPFSSDSAKRVRDEINPVIRNTCEEERILMVDNYSLFLHSLFLLPEVHPNQEGYRALAQNWYRFLEPLLNRK
jgi:lysophospholipase L1-like esterase